jgi:hypothetical protein
MARHKVTRRAPRFEDEIPVRKTPWVVRVGIAIVGLAVAVSSLIPLLQLFQR